MLSDDPVCMGGSHRFRRGNVHKIDRDRGYTMRSLVTIFISILTIPFFLWNGEVFAQSCCGRVALPSGGIDQRPLLEGQTDFRLSYENSLLNRNLLGTSEVDDPLNRWNRTQLVVASLSYGISDRFTTGYLTVMVKCNYALGLSDVQIQFDKWNPSDPRHLELHHIEHHAKGRENIK